MIDFVFSKSQERIDALKTPAQFFNKNSSQTKVLNKKISKTYQKSFLQVVSLTPKSLSCHQILVKSLNNHHSDSFKNN